jgi:2-keto-4-pentenoate hydratase/2-oxohepta-3-ene-1,7-dioic acid hydratase in catechol pathway
LTESEVVFLPPVTHRPTVYCAGANYTDHLAEMGGHAAALAGHRSVAVRPPGMQRLDLTGTPAGTAGAHGNRYLVPGGHVVAEVEGVGTLTTYIG